MERREGRLCITKGEEKGKRKTEKQGWREEGRKETGNRVRKEEEERKRGKEWSPGREWKRENGGEEDKGEKRDRRKERSIGERKTRRARGEGGTGGRGGRKREEDTRGEDHLSLPNESVVIRQHKQHQ